MNKFLMSAVIALGSLCAAAAPASADTLTGWVGQVNTFQTTSYYNTTEAATFMLRQNSFTYQWVSLLRTPYANVVPLSPHQMKLRLSMVMMCARSRTLKLTIMNVANTSGGLLAGASSYFKMEVEGWAGLHPIAPTGSYMRGRLARLNITDQGFAMVILRDDSDREVQLMLAIQSDALPSGYPFSPRITEEYREQLFMVVTQSLKEGPGGLDSFRPIEFSGLFNPGAGLLPMMSPTTLTSVPE